jgi:D-sedoheptulose 7-phosphate isomerase
VNSARSPDGLVSEALRASIDDATAVTQSLLLHLDTVAEIARLLQDAFSQGGRVYVIGNGGSATDATHFAAEFMGKFDQPREGFPVVSLATDGCFLTAWSNDFGFDSVFERQVVSLARPGDVLIAVTTGGGSIEGRTSRNVVTAVERARSIGVTTVGLAGKGGGLLRSLADVCIVVDSGTTARIQEAHRLLLHLITEAFDEMLLGG